MTETVAGMSSLEKAAKKSQTPQEQERAAVQELVRAARARGEDLTGPDGLLKTITKSVLESALEQEMSEHLGYDKHAAEGRNGANSRNGNRTKTVLTDNAGEVRVEVPRVVLWYSLLLGARRRRPDEVGIRGAEPTEEGWQGRVTA
jgi:putative transposase